MLVVIDWLDIAGLAVALGVVLALIAVTELRHGSTRPAARILTALPVRVPP